MLMGRFNRSIGTSVFFSAMFLATVCRAEEGLKIIRPEESKDHVGQSATVEFVVHNTKLQTDKTYGFLNAEKDPTDPKDFIVFISSGALNKLEADANVAQLANYFLCRIQVTGNIQQYREKPEIVVDSLDQIKIIERPKAIKLEEAKDNIGQGVIVEFVVQNSYEQPGKICFLNSEKEFNNPEDFCIFITSNALDKFSADGKVKHPADYFLHKKIRVIGTIKLYKNKPQIDVSSPERIQVID